MFGEVGEKYIIEIGEEIDTAKGKLFRIKGFNSLVFDCNGLMRLEPHIERDEYGFEDGDIDTFKSEGKNEAWDIFRQVLELSPSERNYLFGYEDPKYILRTYEPEEAVEILKNHREQDSFIDELMEKIKLCGKDVSREEVVAFFSSLNDVIEEKPFDEG